MTLNDFKSVEGDRRTGIGSLPVLLGVDRAARVACLFMALPQVAVVARAARLGPAAARRHRRRCCCSRRLLDDADAAPARANARRWYNATGTTLYVLGMLTAAFAVQLAFRPVP